jgi:hypothetical protein
MPPFDLTPGARSLLSVWGAITAGVGERLPTQQLYSVIYNAQRDAGVTPGGFSMRDLSQLRSLAVSQRNADQALARASSSTGIGAEHIGTAPWSRGLNDRNLTPAYEVRFEHRVLLDNELVTFWRTSRIDGTLPGTVGDVLDLVSEDAAALSEGYGVEHVDVGSVSLTAV